MCGDNLTIQHAGIYFVGPALRVRGQRLQGGRLAGRAGTSPARAGTTLADLRIYHWKQCFSFTSLLTGRLGGDEVGRAFSGVARLSMGSPATSWEEPRVRGDDKERDDRLAVVSGPAPRTQGRLREDRLGLAGVGTSPAYAGTTTAARPGRGPSPDQPQVRGDDIVLPEVLSESIGPAPRTWGRQYPEPPPGAGRGTSPAYAGTTGTRCSSSAASWDQPRACGDNDDWHHWIGQPGPRACIEVGQSHSSMAAMWMVAS